VRASPLDLFEQPARGFFSNLLESLSGIVIIQNKIAGWVVGGD